MAKFQYTAKDKTGRAMNGVLEAPDERSLVGALRKQELTVISVKEQKVRQRTSLRTKGGQIKLPELVLFSRQMATMIDAGIPLVQSLEILSEQVENKQFQAIIVDVKKEVVAGKSFHESLAKHPKAFSTLFVNMTKAGEASGSLDDIMDRLASYLEKTDSLLRKVRAALIYPIVVSCMAVIITLIMLIKVVPVFKTMFADFDAQLPVPTLILITISDLLIHTFVIWFFGAIVLFILLMRFIKTDKGRHLFDTFKLEVPIFGILIRKVAVSKFTRTLATLLKSGVPILSALEIVGKTAGNVVVERAVEKVRTSIREGENITTPLAKTKVFPPMVVRMIAVGEQTGELEKMLTKVADFYDDQVDASVAGLTSLIEPLIIAFLGLVVGTIVICMFMPIFKLASVVSN